jgi:hypothetical protein
LLGKLDHRKTTIGSSMNERLESLRPGEAARMRDQSCLVPAPGRRIASCGLDRVAHRPGLRRLLAA